MFDINKYPLLNILIPLLFGMTCASFCIDVIKYNKWISISIILISGLITTLTYILTNSKRVKPLYSLISFYVLFATIGAVMCLSSVNASKVKYGDKWRLSVYKENPFRIESVNHIQQSILSFYHNHGIDGENGAIIEAMTIGVKDNISKDTKDNFSNSGVAHILALSGFHISIIYLILQYVFLSRIVTYRWRWLSNGLVIICLWFYAFISGMSPSLIRSVLMCTILILGTLHTNELISLNGLALSALIMLFLNPLLLFHAGFQMSYLSMLGIYLIGIPLCKSYDSFTFIDSFIWCTICITISCTIFTLPIVSHVFGRIAVLSIFTNIIITTLTYLLFLSFFIWLITFAWAPITSILLCISSLLIKTTTYVSSLSFSNIDVKFSTPTVILYYCILAIIIILINDLKKGKA